MGKETCTEDSASVAPFIEGLRRFSAKFDYYHHDVNGRDSIRRALKQIFDERDLGRVILQFAGHGTKKLSQIQTLNLFLIFSNLFEKKKNSMELSELSLVPAF